MVMPAETIYTETDTQEIIPLVLHTRRIDPAELHELTQLEGALCAYRLGGIGQWILGHISAAAHYKGGRIMVNFEPIPRADMSLMSKWRLLGDVQFAWYAPKGAC